MLDRARITGTEPCVPTSLLIASNVRGAEHMGKGRVRMCELALPTEPAESQRSLHWGREEMLGTGREGSKGGPWRT